MRDKLTVGIVIVAGMIVAGPAQAEIQIGMRDTATIGPIVTGGQTVDAIAAPGVNNDMQLRAADPVASGDPGTVGAPTSLTVTDDNDVFATDPPAGDLACQIVDAHTATCTAPASSWIDKTFVRLDDGNNRLRFASDTLPIREQIWSGDGNDDIATGPFIGDASYRWQSYTNGGNDTVRIGPIANATDGWASGSPPSGLAIDTGSGNDTIHALNGAFDEVDCNTGHDTLYADPWDSESTYIEPGGSCEQRFLAEVPGI